jgi:hypothetical protein
MRVMRPMSLRLGLIAISEALRRMDRTLAMI